MAKPKMFQWGDGDGIINPDHVTAAHWNAGHTELHVSVMGLSEVIVIASVARANDFLDLWSVV